MHYSGAILLCITLAALSVAGPISGKEDHCDIVGYDDLKGRLRMYADVFDSLYRLHTFANASALPRYNRPGCDYAKTKEECEKRPQKTKGGETCPSVRVRNEDRKRVPCVIHELRCECQSCLFPANVNVKGTCRPIYHNVPVMRVDKGQEWTQYLEPIVVGCQCVPHEDNNATQSPQPCKQKGKNKPQGGSCKQSKGEKSNKQTTQKPKKNKGGKKN